jgi:hypothetical protein
MRKLKKQVMLCGHKEYYIKSDKPDDICLKCEKTLKRKVRRYYYAK